MVLSQILNVFIPYNSISYSLLKSNKLYKAVNIIIMFAMDVKHYIYNWHT